MKNAFFVPTLIAVAHLLWQATMVEFFGGRQQFVVVAVVILVLCLVCLVREDART